MENGATKNLYTQLAGRKLQRKKSFAVLIDPDKGCLSGLEKTVQKAMDAGVDYFFAGGSLLLQNHLEECIHIIRQNSDIPVILFPGSNMQISENADAIFFLSLISGRNPDLLIGKHVIAAPFLKESNLEIMPTGYMLIDGGAPTTVSYISNTQPIPADKADIAACTAMAGEMLGLKLIYMDAGSGAKNAIPAELVRKVNESINIPLITGGGIRTPEKAKAIAEAGADVVVAGNAIEKEPALIREMAESIHSFHPVQ